MAAARATVAGCSGGPGRRRLRRGDAAELGEVGAASVVVEDGGDERNELVKLLCSTCSGDGRRCSGGSL